MATGVLVTPPFLQFFNNQGLPAVNGSVLTQVTGVNTATFSDVNLTVPLPNPIPLNSRGEVSTAAGASAQCFTTPNVVYTFTIFDGPNGTGNQLNVATYVNGVQISITASSIGTLLWPRTAAEIAAGITPSNFAYPQLNPFRYGADGANGAADATAYAAANSVRTALVSGIAGWLNDIAPPGYSKTGQEIAAVVTPTDQTKPPDAGYLLNVFRFLTQAQQADVLSGSASIDVSAAIQAANDYVEGRAIGSIGSVNTLVGGAGYNGGGTGTFFPVSLTGGAGQFASASVTVTAGVVTAVTILGPGIGFLVGNVLSITAANLVAAGAAAGGAGATVTVATLATGGKQANPGGGLFFPTGTYNCGSTDLRVGDMVNWIGESIGGTTLKWNNAHTGKCVNLGPDKSGFNGRGGFYAMGCSIERMTVFCGLNSQWGVYTTGLQQNGKVKDVWVLNANGASTGGGVFLKDTFGSANMLCEDVYVVGGQAMAATVNAFQIEGTGSNTVLNRCSCNGNNGVNLAAGIRINGNGDTIIRDFQCEIAVTHIDIASTSGLVVIEKAVMNLSAAGSIRGLYVRAGFTGAVAAIGLDAGPLQLIVQNDVDGFQKTTGSVAGALGMPSYSFSGTRSDYVNIEQFIPGYHRGGNFTVNGAGLTFTPDVTTGTTFLVNWTTNNNVTVGKPTFGPSLFPGSLQQGRRFRIQYFNSSGAAPTATHNAVFKHQGGAFVAPANGQNRTYEYEFDGSTWYEAFRSAADVPN